MAIQDLKVSMEYSGRDISSLSDRPNQDGMSAASLKARFDQLNKEVIPNLNDLIDLLDVYIQTNDSDIVALENAIEGLGISLNSLGLSVQDVLDAYNSGLLSGVYIGTTEPTDPRIKVWINPSGDSIAIDEANRVAQEIVRQTNETIRITDENTRLSNENTRISNENIRISQESSRASAESTRISNEQGRVSAENIRVSSESTRSSNETTRLSNEATRVSSESTRQSNESIRVSSENTRVSNENTRASNENTRISNENARNVFVAYNGSTSYVVGNKVFYNGASYRCKLNSVGNLPTNTTYWDLIAGVITDALNVVNTPSGNISSTTVQGAINELDTEKADKLFATNLVTNGDFSNGTTNWTPLTASTLTIESGALRSTGIVRPYFGQQNLFSIPSGSKVYLRMNLKANKSGDVNIGLSANTDFGFIDVSEIKSITTSFQSISTLLTTNNIIIGFRINGTGFSSGDYIDADNILLLNLTSIFGAGKEPTKEQMDWLLAQKFTNSWFNGTQEISSIKDLLTLLNTKEDISYKGKRILFMGDSITQTVSDNGWVYWFNKYVYPTSFVNVAVSGAWWENIAGTVLDGNPTSGVQANNTIPNQVQKVLNNAYPAFDVIIIFAGTNNAAAGVSEVVENYFTSSGSYIPLISLDLTKTTAAIRWSVEKLQGAYPNAQIFLCTPIQGNEALRSYANIKAKGDKIKEVANRLGIPYFDNLNCGIYGAYENNGTSGKYLADGLHPNSVGAKVLGQYITRKFIDWYSII